MTIQSLPTHPILPSCSHNRDYFLQFLGLVGRFVFKYIYHTASGSARNYDNFKTITLLTFLLWYTCSRDVTSDIWKTHHQRNDAEMIWCKNNNRRKTVSNSLSIQYVFRFNKRKQSISRLFVFYWFSYNSTTVKTDVFGITCK